jgi:hypothetical protein
VVIPVIDYSSKIRIFMSEIIILKLKYPEIIAIIKDAGKDKDRGRIKMTLDMINRRKLSKLLGE